MTELAPDPAVPRRNALLRPLTMAEVLSKRLHAGVPVDRCERTYAKYRVGESLRVVYRYEVDGVTRHVSARTKRTSPAPAVPAPEVGAVLFPFPYDRKLPALPALAPGSPTLENLLGRPVTPRLVSYAAEQSAAAACVGEDGRVLAYAKVQRDDGERRGTEALAGQDAVRVPRLLAQAGDVLVLEALEGRRLDHLDGDALDRALRSLGRTLALLHATPPSGPQGHAAAASPAAPAGRAAPLLRFSRLDPSRLATAAEVIARARPDAAAAADGLLAALIAHASERPAVTLHGDANLRNALQLADGDVALLDLEHLSSGPAAADLGQVLAGLLTRRTDATALLRGYAEVAPLPDRAALRWYTAASVLARVALPAVSRFRPRALAQLRALLDAGVRLA
jgi:Ser/Thr protein kinase RdoA (MazF antagonist)